MVILIQTEAGIFGYMPDGLDLCTFMQYSLTFCSQIEVAGVVKSDTAEEYISVDISVKFGDSDSNCC